MTKEEIARYWYRQIMAESEHEEIRNHYYRRAFMMANSTEIEPCRKYNHDLDDLTYMIEKHGSLKGCKF